ncbi:MAG: aquaporin Z [Chitinophagaceae bacterium]|jgi:aquaporin Z|nr:MAG: aquaporin Z [Chitinophagaceae bacterium]
METKLSQKFVAELIGTFALVLFGCGAAVIAGKTTAGALSGLGLLGIAFAFGLAQLIMCYAIGGISGSHINPAVTIGMLIVGKIKIGDAIAYIIAQLIGAALAAFVLMAILRGLPDFQMGEWALGSNGWGPGYQNGYSMGSAFLAETVMTFLFLFVIFGVTSKRGYSSMAGIAIGLALTAIHLFTIPITGTSVNPARSFGPAIFAGGIALSQLWLFFAAPILGAIISALVWRALDKKNVAA